MRVVYTKETKKTKNSVPRPAGAPAGERRAGAFIHGIGRQGKSYKIVLTLHLYLCYPFSKRRK
jgi:hypothetical protein